MNPSPMIERGIMPAFDKLGFTCILAKSPQLNQLKYPECMNSKLTIKEKYEILYNTIKKYKNKIDIVFLNWANYFYMAIPNACKDLKKYFIYWATEDPVLFDLMNPLARQADLVLSPAIECVEIKG